MTAMDVYWVMQLDSICHGATVIGILMLVSSAFLILFAVIALTAPYVEEPDRKMAQTALGYGQAGITVSIALCLIVMFIPSSRTAAAMYVLPAIVNNEDVHQEMKEIYELAKDGLKQLVKAEKE